MQQQNRELERVHKRIVELADRCDMSRVTCHVSRVARVTCHVGRMTRSPLPPSASAWSSGWLTCAAKWKQRRLPPPPPYASCTRRSLRRPSSTRPPPLLLHEQQQHELRGAFAAKPPRRNPGPQTRALCLKLFADVPQTHTPFTLTLCLSQIRIKHTLMSFTDMQF